jgi:hypothetical protein
MSSVEGFSELELTIPVGISDLFAYASGAVCGYRFPASLYELR